MELLEQKIRVNKEAYKSLTYDTMSESLEDAYNNFLSQFVARKQDEKYNDNAHQYLATKDGKIYYFDSFKYIYPADNSDDLMQALNSNVGNDKLCIVEYTGNSIIIQDWNFNNNSVNFSSNFITDETRRYIDEAYGQKISMGYFLQQISGHNLSACESLEKGSDISVKEHNGKLTVYDNEGNVIDEKNSLPRKSFYSQINESINHYDLLDSQYSKGHTR